MTGRPPPVSKHLDLRQLRALETIGDVLVPGDEDFPSFSELGCVAHVDRLLDFLPEADRRDLKRLLWVVSFLPRWLVGALLCGLSAGARASGRWTASLRVLHLGLRGLVLGLYYSGQAGPGFARRSPLDVLSYRVGVAGPGKGQ